MSNEFFNDNDNTQQNVYRGGSQFNYSWNKADPFNEPNMKKPKRGKRIVLLALGIVLFAMIVAFVTVGVYNNYLADNMQNSKTNEGTPSVNITDIKDYDKANNPPVSDGKPLTTVQIVEKCKPSVVGIVSSAMKGGFMSQGSGSGIIMSEDGYIITNQHVINGASDVSVVFENGKNYKATIIGQDSKSDIAVLKINEKGLKVATFGNSDNLKEGEPVVAIGNPMGLELFGTSTFGYVSAINRDITINDRVMTLIQTDASINAGNSGGPLINQYGQVIGINSVKLTSATTPVEGLGFAIPINTAKPIIDSIIKYGYVKDRPFIGISGENLDAMSASFYGVPEGIIITSVTDNGGAEAAGIRRGDIITGADGEEIKTMAELNLIKDRFKSGDTMKLRIWRDGETLEVKVKLAEDKQNR